MARNPTWSGDEPPEASADGTADDGSGTWSGDDAPRAVRVATPAPAEGAPRYRDTRTLGQGSIGVVKVVFDGRLDREVAHKSLKMASSAATARFLREARITASLEHPGIVPVHDIGQQADGSWFYTMRFVRGKTLEERMAACTTLEQRLRLLPHFVDLCQALAYAHHRGVVHRDIKPANVIVGEFGETQILDWGLAKGKDEVHSRDDEMAKVGAMSGALTSSGTLVGTILGTPAYMSPEQAFGKIGAIDARSDVWSLGAILYELLTGDRAFDGEDAWQVVAKVRLGNVPPVRTAEPSAPPELSAVAEKALANEPADRYQTAAELASDVAAWMTGGRVSAHRYSVSEEAARLLRAYRAPLIVGAVAAVLLAVGGAYSVLRVIDEKDRAVGAEAVTRANLGELYTVRALDLLEQARWPEAALLAATSLTYGESPEARGALLAATEHPWPRLVRGFHATCTDAELARERVFCGSNHGLVIADLATGAAPVTDVRPLAWVEVAADGAVTATGRHAMVARVESPEGVVRDVTLEHPLAAGAVFAMSPEGVIYAADSTNGVLGRVPGPFLPVALGGTAATWSPMREAWAVARAEVGVPWLMVDGTTGVIPGTEALAARALAWLDGSHLATGNAAGHVVVVDTDAARVVADFDAHRGVVESVVGVGDLIASTGEDGLFAVHDAGGELRFRLAMAPTTQVHRDAQGRIVTYDAMEPSLRVWELAEAAADHPIRAASGLVGAAFRPDGSLVAVARGGHVTVHASDGTVLVGVDVGAAIEAGVPSPDGSRLALALPDALVVLDEALAEVVRVELERPVAVAWSEDGHVVVVGERGALSITAIDLFTGERRGLVAGVAPRAIAVRGSHVAFTDEEGRARVVDLGTGSVQGRFVNGDARAVAWRDADTVLLSMGDGTVTSWSYATDQAHPHAYGALHPHLAEIAAMAVSPDGAVLATASWDRTVRLWNTATSDLVAVLPGHAHRVGGVGFSSDGKQIVTTSWDGTARTWTLAGLSADPATVIAQVRDRVGLTMADGRVVPIGFELSRGE